MAKCHIQAIYEVSQDAATATVNKVLTVLLSRQVFESKSEVRGLQYR